MHITHIYVFLPPQHCPAFGIYHENIGMTVKYQVATEQCPLSIQVILKKPDPNLESLYTDVFYNQVPLLEKSYVS